MKRIRRLTAAVLRVASSWDWGCLQIDDSGGVLLCEDGSVLLFRWGAE